MRGLCTYTSKEDKAASKHTSRQQVKVAAYVQMYIAVYEGTVEIKDKGLLLKPSQLRDEHGIESAIKPVFMKSIKK